MGDLSFHKIHNYLSTVVETKEKMQASFIKEKLTYLFLGEEVCALPLSNIHSPCLERKKRFKLYLETQ